MSAQNSQLFEPRSVDALFSAIMTRQEIAEEKTETFRIELRTRFERGSKRMEELAAAVEQIRIHDQSIDNRVTRLEDSDITRRINTLELAESAIRTELARFKGALWVIGGLLGILQAVGITLLSNYLNH